MTQSSVYTEEEWKELEKSVEAVKKWRKTGKRGALVISQRIKLAKKVTPTKIKRVRKIRNLTQERLAEALNTSVDTIRSWEQDKSHPRGPALKLLDLFEKHPEVF